MVLGKLPEPGRPTIWIIVWQGPTALAVGAGGGCLDIFTLIYPFSPLSPSLSETARYRLKYCLKGPLNPKQPTNQLINSAKVNGYTFRASNSTLLIFVSLLSTGQLFKERICCSMRKFCPARPHFKALPYRVLNANRKSCIKREQEFMQIDISLWKRGKGGGDY